VDAILLAASGYQPAKNTYLLEHLNPQLILISCEAGACPSQEDESDHADLNTHTTLITGKHGSIELATDGQTLWITTEHNPEPAPASEQTKPLPITE
jgi:hypothetical protein